MMTFERQAYFERIGFHGPASPTLSLSNRQFNDGERQDINDESALYQLLQERFGLRFDHPQYGISFAEFAAICPK
ncbi:hypothetical protein M975_1293 [Buttiauxella brennerae ATCC 51605]|uniref:Uncharacterized protein n=1 Tax=Buttiauxella brennerae ATCC 51605 TaxID=1354251 RepID=A0A1B7ISS2_9ENTR|nr:hypothetical protein [Buttiauxella brennerae]OAT32854.1 hypothetical protein M975_1293 [Buttiauxella brennerae ATCC 51605]